MGRRDEREECRLAGTRYCGMLNAHSCKQCPVDRESPEAVTHDLDLYESLLPEGGLNQLFEGRECQFCRGEPERKRGYALLAMAHPELRRIQRRTAQGQKRRVQGALVPLQFAICARCRRTFLWIEYLPTVLPLVVGSAMLAAVSGGVGERLAALAPFAPFFAWLASVLLSMVAGQLLSHAVCRAAEPRMLTDVLRHPVVRAMIRNGWVPILRQNRTKLMFSKTRLSRGLGTAAQCDGETPENARVGQRFV